MRSISSLLCAVGVAAFVSGVSAAASAQVVVAGPGSNIIRVQADTPEGRRGFWHDRGYTYYNGHRGYREHRPGFRYYNGFWFPPAAFVVAAPVVVAPPVAVAPPPASPHVDWCIRNMPGYNAYDNTYQPSYGPRQSCHSPYGG